ncbi:MAG: hypothetical protein ACOYLE_05365 [Bacteroidales bacterium]
MKKINAILVLVCFLGVFVTSCVKDNETDILIEQNVQKTEINSSAKLLTRLKSLSNSNYSGTFSLSSNVGHKSEDCGGKCTYTNGVWRHVDCQGAGHNCAYKASVSITKTLPDKPEDKYYTGMGLNDYEPIDEATFNMPARSFYIEDKIFDNGYIWINIPEQVLERDIQTKQFIYKNITFTSIQKFKNL